MTMEEKYRVVIKEVSTGKVVSVIGTGLSKAKAEQRVMTGLMRIDTGNYFVTEEKE